MRARHIAAVLGVLGALASHGQATPRATPRARWSADTRAQIAGTLPQVSQLTGDAPDRFGMDRRELP
jgi:hypothetical protein